MSYTKPYTTTILRNYHPRPKYPFLSLAPPYLKRSVSTMSIGAAELNEARTE